MGGDRSEHWAPAANCCLFERQTFQYFHTDLTTGPIYTLPLLVFKLLCCLIQSSKMIRRAPELRLEITSQDRIVTG